MKIQSYRLGSILFFIGISFMTIVFIQSFYSFINNEVEVQLFIISIVIITTFVLVMIKGHLELEQSWEKNKVVPLFDKTLRLYQLSKKRKYQYKNKILTDDFEENPIEFGEYASTISDFIKTSKPNFSVGIFGDWGTGKTTLMKLIEKELQNGNKLSWNAIIAKNENAITELKNFLKKRLINIDWIDEISPILKKNEIIFDQNFIKINQKKLLKIQKYRSIPEESDRNLKEKELGLKKKIFNLFFYGIYMHFYDIYLLFYLFYFRYLLLKSYGDEYNNKIILKLKNNIIVYYNEKILFDIQTEKENDQFFLILKEKEVIPVWFNAWRYEREEHLASIALMKKIGYSLSDIIVYKDIKKILLRGLLIIGKDIVRNIAINYGNISEKSIEDLEKKILPKADILSQLDKDTLYFDGLEKISNEMRQISKYYVIVVLIDDLDRCTPNKSLEILESMKIFFDMLGFVFVVGLSNKKVEKLITTEFEKSGITGKDYLEKIIQIQISIPNWTPKSISYLIDKYVDRNLISKPYDIIMKDNKEQLAQSIKLTPRDLKIYINNFIFILETYFIRKSSIPWKEDITNNFEFFNFINKDLKLKWISNENCNMLNNKEIITLRNTNKKINSLLNKTNIEETLIYKIFNDENRSDVLYLLIFPLNYQIFLVDNVKILYDFYIFEKYDSKYLYSKNKATDLLILLSFEQRWNECFVQMEHHQVREKLRSLCTMTKEKRDKAIDLIIKENNIQELTSILTNMKDSPQFWSFLEIHNEIIFIERDWSEYIMVIESIQKPLGKSQTEQIVDYWSKIPMNVRKKI